MVRHIRNPVQLARRVLEDTPHVFLAGAGAEQFAVQAGIACVSNEYFITPERRGQLEALRRQLESAGQPSPERQRQALAALEEPPMGAAGTVGAVARDRAGRLAAATSTGGMNGKRPGRVGRLTGHRRRHLCRQRMCAVSTTGHGEWFLRTVQAYDIWRACATAEIRWSRPRPAAIVQRLSRLGRRRRADRRGSPGEIVMRYNTPTMFRASVRAGEAASVQIY